MKHQAPSSFSTANTHRVLLLQPDIAQGDFGRIEDLLADGLSKVRLALKRMQEIGGDHVLALQPAEHALRQALEKRRLLTSDMRHAIARWCQDAHRAIRLHGPDPVVASVRGLLDDALAASDRVLDLLAAERELEWHRA